MWCAYSCFDIKEGGKANARKGNDEESSEEVL